MLGTACFRLCIRGSQCAPTVALSHVYRCSPHPYPAQATCRHATSISFSQSLSWTRQQTVANAGGRGLHVASCVKRPCCHTCSCVEEGSEVRCATIWHGLLPSHHPSILDQNIISPSNNSHSFSSFDPHFGSSSGSTLSVSYEDHVGSDSSISGLGMLQVRCGRVKGTSGLSFPDASAISMGRFAMAAGLLDGSWNVAWDARPARWLHGRHSAWLLFGVCACFSAATSVSVPNMPLPPSPLMHVEGVKEQLSSSGCGSDCEIVPAENVIEGKQVFTDYTVIGIPGDGRCLFRAIAYGVCLGNGDPGPSESSQRELADELRDKVVDELVSRRADSEWFIEETFDSYVKRMRERHVWGGEPELLMASHVLKMPITVHLFDRSSGGLLSIAEYGLEYGSENPIRVLYHGFGHYDAVQVPGSGTHSKV